MNISYSIIGKNSIGLCTVNLQGVHWSYWGDATGIQSDIQRLWELKSVQAVPLPFSKKSDATVFVPSNSKSLK